MTAVSTIIGDALIEIGAFAVGDAIPASDFQFALRTLNRMLALWNNDALMIYTQNRQVFNLVAGKQTYSIGTGGDFNIPRPTKIPLVSVLINSGPNPLEMPMDIMTDEEWQQLNIKQTTSTFPVKVWFDGNSPLLNAWFWPVPTTAANQVVLYSWNTFQPATSINSTVAFPDGYDEALVSNLALMLCTSYGIQPNPLLIKRAQVSKHALQSVNNEPMYARLDIAALSGRSLAIKTRGLLVDPQ